MTGSRARIVCLIAVAVWLACMIAGTFIAHAVEYKPDTREALLFRPEKPTERLRAPQTCIGSPAKPQRVTWVLRDASGNIIIIGSTVVRRRC